MHLTAIRAKRFRNLQEVDISLPPGLTLVMGPNGQGKTSLLEAAYVLATGRSFRTRKLDDLVAWDGGPMSVRGRIAGRMGEVETAISIGTGERTLMVNGITRGLESFLGHLDVVDLTADRMAVLRGPPDERRRFLDRGVVGFDASHLRVIGDYRRVLQQRNALLRRGGAADQLDVWDERLTAAAKRLHYDRRNYAERLAARIEAIGPELLPEGSLPRLAYRPSPPELHEVEEDGFDEAFAGRLTRCRGRDRELGHTTEGPHRDDLRVELNSVDLRRFGSAGQVRAAMIGLKLGKLSLMKEERGEAPLFLLDDFDTDLDDARMAALLECLGRAGGQVLAATSKEETIGRIGLAELKLRMENGVATAA